MDAFDADVLIYAVIPGHDLGVPVRALIEDLTGPGDQRLAVGSVLLLPELLTRPLRLRARDEIFTLTALLDRIDLRSTSLRTADLAVTLGATYGLRAADAVHLATAVLAGADRFVTNNRRDFAQSITEIDVVYPEDLRINN